MRNNTPHDAAARFRAPSIVSLIVVAAASGCIFDPFEGCGDVVSIGWNEPGLYDAFPPQGRVGDFIVRWSDGHGESGPFKDANDKNLTDDMGVTVKFLRVYLENETGWSINRPTPLSDEDSRALLEKTFRELGLPPPEHAPQEFDWRTAAC